MQSPKFVFMRQADALRIKSQHAPAHEIDDDIAQLEKWALEVAANEDEKREVTYAIAELRLSVARSLTRGAALARELLDMRWDDPFRALQAVAAFAGRCLRRREAPLALDVLREAYSRVNWTVQPQGIKESQGTLARLLEELEQATDG